MSYLSGDGSLVELCIKYKIHAKQQLSNWIMKYNSHEKLKTSGTGGGTRMAKGRKTTFEERINIITYCIEHELNYSETADEFQVSYHQVYTWIKKYNTQGIDSLIDKRGKRIIETEMTEIDKLKFKNKQLEAEKRRLELENAF